MLVRHRIVRYHTVYGLAKNITTGNEELLTVALQKAHIRYIGSSPDNEEKKLVE